MATANYTIRWMRFDSKQTCQSPNLFSRQAAIKLCKSANKHFREATHWVVRIKENEHDIDAQ